MNSKSPELVPESTLNSDSITPAENIPSKQVWHTQNLESEIIRLSDRLLLTLAARPYDLVLISELLETINTLMQIYEKVSVNNPPSPAFGEKISQTIDQSVKFFTEVVFHDPAYTR